MTHVPTTKARAIELGWTCRTVFQQKRNEQEAMVKADWTILEKAGTGRAMFVAPKESAIFSTLQTAIGAFSSGLVEVVGVDLAAQRRLKRKRQVVKTEANAQQIADGELRERKTERGHLRKRSATILQRALERSASVAPTLSVGRDAQIVAGIEHLLRTLGQLQERATRENKILVVNVFYASLATLFDPSSPEFVRPLMDRQRSCPLKPGSSCAGRFTLPELRALGWKETEPAYASRGPYGRSIENGVQDYVFENYPSLAYHAPSTQHNVYHINVKPNAGQLYEAVGVCSASIGYSFQTLLPSVSGPPTFASGVCQRPLRSGAQPGPRLTRLEPDEEPGWRLHEALRRSREGGSSTTPRPAPPMPEPQPQPEPAVGFFALLCMESCGSGRVGSFHTIAIDEDGDGFCRVSRWNGQSAWPTAPFPTGKIKTHRESTANVRALLLDKIHEKTHRGKRSEKEASLRYATVLLQTAWGGAEVPLDLTAANAGALRARIALLSAEPET